MSDRRPEAVLFDFNGVVVDDEPLHHEAYVEVLAGRGLELGAREYFDRYLGLDDRGFLTRFHEDRGRELSSQGLVELVEEKAAAYARRMDRVPLVAGVAEALADIGRRVPVAVVSGALRAEIEGLLRRFGLRDAVRAVVSAEDVQRGKPQPEGYLLGLQRLGSPSPGSCLAIEDAPAGIRAAQAAGLDCWAISSSRSPAELAEATRVLPSLEGIRYEDLRVEPGVMVVAGVLEAQGGLLLCRRPAGGREPGKWELPGGKVEPGESLAEALERELWEELRLRVEVGREVGRVRLGRAELVFLEVRARDLSQLGRHHYPEFAFVPREAAAGYDLLEADRRFLQMQGG